MIVDLDGLFFALRRPQAHSLAWQEAGESVSWHSHSSPMTARLTLPVVGSLPTLSVNVTLYNGVARRARLVLLAVQFGFHALKWGRIGGWFVRNLAANLAV